jgi:hypothetical protein
MFKRAKGFFDVVAYSGDNSDGTKPHSLGVTPELILTKIRSGAGPWIVTNKDLSNPLTKYLNLQDTSAELSTQWMTALPDEDNLYYNLGGYTNVNESGQTYISYLFATLAGISKVGSYTGNGSNQNIACGFSGGARFVMIKRTDSTGDWYIWDSTRGIVAGNDPHLSLNSTAAEVTSDDSIDPVSTGFTVNQVSATNINVSSGEYIFLAIA